MRLLHAVAMLFQVIDKFPQVLGREILLGDDHGWRVRRKSDRHEIALGIVLHARREHRSGDMRAHATRE
jgi:hypothetical protein